jgi:hypothetical protein
MQKGFYKYTQKAEFCQFLWEILQRKQKFVKDKQSRTFMKHLDLVIHNYTYNLIELYIK